MRCSPPAYCVAMFIADLSSVHDGMATRCAAAAYTTDALTTVVYHRRCAGRSASTTGGARLARAIALLVLAACAAACQGRGGAPERTGSAEPPYHSVSELPPHRQLRWTFIVQASDTRTFQVGELRAVDIPLPESSPWKCRIDHAKILPKYDLVVRALACSNDNWRSRLEISASYCATEGCTDPPEDNALDLYGQASHLWVHMEKPRARAEDAELP